VLLLRIFLTLKLDLTAPLELRWDEKSGTI